ncbi:MAG TPA: hypothetical protein PLY93_11535, partial [Turneriella sp.]|nr:hypothetical protein [Turneriella sp.]
RKLAHYPPYVSLARLILIGHAEEIVFREAEKLAKAIEPINTKDLFEKTEISQGTVSLLGPALPQLTKIDNEYRVHFLIKAPSESVLRSYLVRIHPILERFEKSASSRFILDMDPRETS